MGATYAPGQEQYGGDGGVGRIRIEYCESLSGSTNPISSTQKLDCYIKIVTNTPYAIQVYTLTLANSGASVDTFHLSHIATDTSALPPALPGEEWKYDWVVRIPTSVMTVGAGLSETARITVEIPEQEVTWVTHTLTFTATSQTYATQVTATLQTSTGGHWNGEAWVGCRFDLGFTNEVNFDDVRETYNHFGSTVDLRYDFGHTNEVNFDDVRSAYARFGQTCAP